MPKQPTDIPKMISLNSGRYGHSISSVDKRKICQNCAHDNLHKFGCTHPDSKNEGFKDVPEEECFKKRKLLNEIIKVEA